MKRVLIFLARVIALTLTTIAAPQAFVLPAHADDAITVTSTKFTNNFPTKLLFQLEAQSSAKITQVALIVEIDGQSASSRYLPEFSSDPKIEVTYEWMLGRNYLPPGVTGQYWWTIQDNAGNQKQSDKRSFRVDDPAHKWQKLANAKLALYWYAGGDSFGKALFERGVQAMNFLEQDTNVTVDSQVQIFIYGNRSDFRQALEPGATEWTGGRAFPDYGIVLINVEPSNLEWGKSATTHEMTHVVIRQKIRGPLGSLSMPHWMDEGLAVYYESPGSLDSQFSIPLKRAIQNDTLVPIRSLTGSFPADSSAANLAYAQSYSVVDFIIRHYGREKLAQLLQVFKSGAFYDDALRQVLGVDTDGLEVEWRKDIGAKPRAIATRPATQPTVFPTFSLSTDATPTPGVASATPRSVVVNVTPAPPQATTPSTPAGPFANLCAGVFGFIALGIFGATLRRRKARV